MEQAEVYRWEKEEDEKIKAKETGGENGRRKGDGCNENRLLDAEASQESGVAEVVVWSASRVGRG